MIWTEKELSYLAGIIDGEGCFNIYNPGGKSHTLRLFVMSTSQILIDYLYETYGGFKYSRKRENEKWKIRHEWFVDTTILDGLLPQLHPYLLIKKEHCEVAMRFRKTYIKSIAKYHKVPDDLKLIREECHSHMKILNKKGPL